MDNGMGQEIPKKVYINSRYFTSKLNLIEIFTVLESTDDIAIFVDEKILPEINDEKLDYKDYLEVVNAVTCLGVYGENNKLKTNELKGFILIVIDLLYSNFNLDGSFVYLTNNEIKTRNRAIEFINSLNQLEMDESVRVKLLIDFVLNNYEKEKELIKKSVMLTPEHIKKINQVEGKGFSSKIRFILDSYFIQNKSIVTEEELTLGVNNNILEIYQKLKKEILSWNKEIKFKPINDYLIFSYYYRFLKLSFKIDEIILELSFSENKPFEDYKSITKEVKINNEIFNESIVNEIKLNKIRKVNFTLNSYEDIEYALFLIKQSYENNNQDIYSYTAYNHSIHKLFNDVKRYDFFSNKKVPKNDLPRNGLFVLFEKGEKFLNEDRIVYIGSNIKENRIPKMLNFIFEDGNGDNTIFRKNIGRSLLAKDDNKYLKKFDLNNSSNLISNWDMDLKEFNEKYSEDSKENEQIKKVEKMVSKYIQDHFSFAIIEINDKLKRLHLKSKIISSLSLSDEYQPSDKWLGYYSPRKKIRKYGIWLEQHLGNRENQLTKEDIEFLKKIVNS